MPLNRYLPEGMMIGRSENREYISSVQGLERAKNEGKILEGTVTMCDSDTLCLHLDLCGVEGIIEKSEAIYGAEAKDIAIITRVGKAVAFKILDIERDSDGKVKRTVLSRKEAQRECMHSYLMDLIPGDIIPARVTHLEPFGAFVDIGCGIPSLISIDSVSVSRISSPRDRFAPREEIMAVVKSIDYETGRIYTSTKELFGTWEENVANFKVGQTVSGVVRSVEGYGIFVELAPNLAGLAELKEGVSVGQMCAVYIKSIMPEKMKIKLVIIDAYEQCSCAPKREYYINTKEVKHIDYWRYSPIGCEKIIETDFGQ